MWRFSSRLVRSTRSTRSVELLPTSVTTGVLARSEEHTSELQSQSNLVCRLLLEKKKKNIRSTVSVLGLLKRRSIRQRVDNCNVMESPTCDAVCCNIVYMHAVLNSVIWLLL